MTIVSFEFWQWISDPATGDCGSGDFRRHASCALWLQQVFSSFSFCVSEILYLELPVALCCLIWKWMGLNTVSTWIFSVGGRQSHYASWCVLRAQWIHFMANGIEFANCSLIFRILSFCSTPFELHDDAYVLKAMSLQEHQGSETAEVMGHTDFDDGLGCNFDEDSPPLSSIFQHSSFPPHTTSPYYPVSMPSAAAKGSPWPPVPGILKARVKHENLSSWHFWAVIQVLFFFCSQSP